MKHNLTIRINFLILVLFCSTMYAQRSLPIQLTDAVDAKQYITNHITELNPIEGIYDVENNVYASTGRNASTRKQHFTWIILDLSRLLKNNQDPEYVVYSASGDARGEMGIVTPLSQELYYVLEYTNGNNTEKRERFLLENGMSFEISSLQYFAGIGSVTMRMSGIKTFPTTKMYQEAIRKHLEEESKPQMWTGTGFALNDNHIVTNYHVIDEAKSISVQGVNGNFNNKYSAEVVAKDKFNDLAILKINGINISNNSIPYAVKTSTSDVGEDVFVLGYPLTSTMGDEIKLTTGVVSSKTGFQGDVSLYQISAPIQPGNSGGPLFDGKGNVIGIVSAKHRGAENVSYAIKASYLRNLMETAISSDILPKTNKMAGQNLSSKVKMAKNFVYYITCSSQEEVNNALPGNK